MNSDKMKQEWIDLSSAWINEARHGRNPTRNGLLDPPMLEACGNVAGLSVLDCGCGEGRFCRILSERGAAYTLGLDLCEPMIEAAAQHASAGQEYRVADVHHLDFIEDATFDLAISYLNQCDLADVDANNCEIFRVLKPSGRFIVANLHPMRSAVGGWQWSDAGEKLHVIVDRYFDESTRQWRMMGVDFTNFHRTLSTYLHSFLATGFALEDLVEPSVTQQQLEDYPELSDELRVPNFIVYVLKKP